MDINTMSLCKELITSVTSFLSIITTGIITYKITNRSVIANKEQLDIQLNENKRHWKREKLEAIAITISNVIGENTYTANHIKTTSQHIKINEYDKIHYTKFIPQMEEALTLAKINFPMELKIHENIIAIQTQLSLVWGDIRIHLNKELDIMIKQK